VPTSLVWGSMVETVPSWPLATHTRSAPNAIPVGPLPTLMVASTLEVLASSRSTASPEVLVTQTTPSPNATWAGARGRAICSQGVTPDELWEALWPDRPVNRGTLHTTVTAARTGLGRAPDGTRYLPDAHDGQFRLSPQVGLDWGRFHALVASGEGDTPEGLEALRSALELVRGVPLTFPTGRGYEWAVVHRTEMETVIAEVAERLALRYLDLGNHRQANWAARRGLLASPYDERLYRVLMRAADAAGNPAGVDAVWQELLSVLDADLELVDDELHPETIDLYGALWPRGRPRRESSHGARPSPPPSGLDGVTAAGR
jgi:Bacterial transcriptional activator domain